MEPGSAKREEAMIRIGLEKQLVLPGDLNAMRKAIALGARESGLIHNCLVTAETNGFSGEDKYTLLAFHALQMLEELYRCNMETLTLRLEPVIIPKKL